MTQKQKVTLDRIDQKLDDLIDNFKAVAIKVESHETEINKAKGWAVAASTIIGGGIAIISHFWGKK